MGACYWHTQLLTHQQMNNDEAANGMPTKSAMGPIMQESDAPWPPHSVLGFFLHGGSLVDSPSCLLRKACEPIALVEAPGSPGGVCG